ncbi:DUF2461 domain-containing protein [Paractinoplanes brasiliensis]|uniref:Uncharacterized protein (TIGR02453 family) n=1 Tax=Paractinoplanes brasiliensis TaxID=52695 RepID=A0A4R6J756_9ACTN|nr:DUF2461 domain-containing protein [Actinoplanes brasiliensis]TDO31334.1 uncharacterized protein (TIGR02453 family) [Actinoplanes brasiliensis]GID28337.1 TIGR02453 family protein [Actinoplanes brasiliensis]
MTFRGWPVEALEFYEGLAADNSKTYWTARREFYEEHVRGPMLELLAALEPEFGPGKVFRPYRDVRFSKDKTPYKTHLGAWLEAGGYIQLSADGLAAGCGMYQLDGEQLQRYRRAVADDKTGEELTGIIASIEGGPIRVHGHGSLKSAPRGFAKDHPRVDLLRHKGLTTWQEWQPAAWLGTNKAQTRVTAFLRASRPLKDWLDTHVGR